MVREVFRLYTVDATNKSMCQLNHENRRKYPAKATELTVAVSTGYHLAAFLDPGPQLESVDGMEYQNYPLKNCSVQLLELVQGPSPVADAQVARLA
jgi:hypothetical protein